LLSSSSDCDAESEGNTLSFMPSDYSLLYDGRLALLELSIECLRVLASE